MSTNTLTNPNSNQSPRKLSREEFTSFSRFDAYKRCSEFYHLKYVQGLKEEKPFNKYLQIGSLVHNALAEYLDEGTPTSNLDDAFYLHLGGWLDGLGLDMEAETVVDAIEPAAHLLWRASQKCNQGELLLRKTNGDLMKDPINYPSREFKRLCWDEGITLSFKDLDNLAANNNPAFTRESFSWIAAKCLYLVKFFRFPSWIEKTDFVEVGISTNEDNRVDIPGCDIALQGYIDWAVTTKDGRFLILDHKTSKKKPSVEEVFLHPQLNLYVWLIEKVYGIKADLIGINHLESGEFVVTEVDPSVVSEVVYYYSQLQHSIDSGVHYRRYPTEFGTPCIKRDWKTEEVLEVCPFLSHCHPIFAEIIANELQT